MLSSSPICIKILQSDTFRLFFERRKSSTSEKGFTGNNNNKGIAERCQCGHPHWLTEYLEN